MWTTTSMQKGKHGFQFVFECTVLVSSSTDMSVIQTKWIHCLLLGIFYFVCGYLCRWCTYGGSMEEYQRMSDEFGVKIMIYEICIKYGILDVFDYNDNDKERQTVKIVHKC